MFYWGLFLQKPEARQDPQYQLISNLYQQVKDKTTPGGAAATATTTTGSTATDAATSTPKKKRSPANQQQQAKVTQMDGTIQP
jgi:hypothetical protein